MKEFIIKLLNKWSCSHDWEYLRDTKYYTEGYTRPTNVKTLFCCNKCGKFKFINS